MAAHVHRDAYAVREYVLRKRVIVTWCSGLTLFPDAWTKAVTTEQFVRYWHHIHVRLHEIRATQGSYGSDDPVALACSALAALGS